MRELTDFEQNLIDLVQYLSVNGLNLKEIKHFLVTKSKDHNNATPIEHIQKHGAAFLNELKIFINENEIG